jgi:protein SCO1/2
MISPPGKPSLVRPRRSLLVACGVFSAVALSSAGTGVAAPQSGDERTISTTPSLSVIGHAPDFTLRDTSDQPVRLADYRGRAVLLAFIFTTCPGVCPLISKQMEYIQAKLKGARLFGTEAALLSVTIDPQTDTTPVLAAYARQYGADPAGWRFLRESEEKTRPVLKAYDEWTKKLPKGEFDHPARVYLIDRRGNIREIYSLAFFNEKQALVDIQALLKEPAR